MRDPAEAVDRYFGREPSAAERLRTSAALAFALRGCALDPARAQHWSVRGPAAPGGPCTLEPSDAPAPPPDPGRDIVVSTVRMGYGHHRIALGVCSHAETFGRRALLLDLLASPRDEAKALGRLDGLYSLMSRLSAELGGPLEAFWGRLMMSGGVEAARLAFLMAARLGALLEGLPRDVPFVSAYPLNGHIAVGLGFTRVVNLIFDNDPQPFLIVPGALNLTQTTSSLEKLRLLGTPAEEAAVAGHWVGRELLEGLEGDARARIARVRAGAPRRLLLSIGGAGAQRKFVFAYLEALRPLLEAGSVRVLLNLGDHGALRGPFDALLRRLGVGRDAAHGPAALEGFLSRNPLGEGSGAADAALAPVTVFSSGERFDAVRATDRLLRAADVLVTKPSELAFVPVPKLHIRRVGDHEAASARRSAELGDGSLELREPREAARLTRLWAESAEFLVPMNERIVENARRGVYDGAKRAVERVLSLPARAA